MTQFVANSPSLVRRAPLKQRPVNAAGQALAEHARRRQAGASTAALFPPAVTPASQKLSLFESELLTAWALE